MAKGKTETISEVIVALFRENGLEQSILEQQVVEAWPQVMGQTVTALTRSVEVKSGMLVVHIDSAVLKAQLFENRFELIRRLNEKVGAPVIKDCRILG